ncbi:MAG: NYN domain-containing protein [Sphingomonadaceae bacterium]
MAIQDEKMRASVIADDVISVTIDASDLTAASAEPLRSIINRYGRPVAARAFADFQQPGLSDLSVQLYQMGFTLVHCPTWPNGDGTPKPIVSDVMAQDLRDQLEELGGVETYLLVATSRDYIAVANALRRHDRRVVVVAEESKVCREFRLCADEFVALPPSRPEPARAGRSAESGRAGRGVAAMRAERQAEPVRLERPAEAARAERVAEPARVERVPEPVRVERVPEPVRVETQEQVRLPSDGEVLAEVRRIIAAEGICTPRRLARALCPVDRTPTGELRSRIANRIQALVDSGKLLRERLVVGGTSVETILTREEKNGRTVLPAAVEDPAPIVASSDPSVAPKESESGDSSRATVGQIQGEPVPEAAAEPRSPEPERAGLSPMVDLDAFVESVLRGSDPVAASPVGEPLEVAAEPAAETLAVEPVAAPAEEEKTETAQAEPAPAEKPKRTRSRRKSPPKVAAAEPQSDGVA